MFRPDPLVSNSFTRRLISWRLRRFRTLTSPISVMPTVHQKHAPPARWVALTDTLEVAQRIAGHADSRTTKLYDRRGQKVLLEDMERIRY